MLKVNDLKKFCLASDDRLAEPISDDDFTYATDGHIAIRIKRINEITKKKSINNFPDLSLKPWHEGKWVKMPKYQCPTLETCPVCGGARFIKKCPECNGEEEIIFSNAYNDYECECQTCGGEGDIPGGKDDLLCDWCEGKGKTYTENCPFVIIHDDTRLNIRLLDKIKNLPDIQLFFPASEGVVNIKFEGGVGILMMMRHCEDW